MKIRLPFQLPLSRCLALPLFLGCCAGASNVWTEYPGVVNSNSVMVKLTPDGEAPELMAVVVLTNDPMETWRRETDEARQRWLSERKTNNNAKLITKPSPPSVDYFEHARWIPFATILLVDLGPGDGKRQVLLSFRDKGQTRSGGWSGGSVTVQTSSLVIGITNPQRTTSQPIVQLKGYSSRRLASIYYDVLGPHGEATVRGEQGVVNHQYFDQAQFEFTTNYFTCYDIQLSPGTNTIALHFKDQAGNTLNTNVTLVLDLQNDRTPPAIALRWPANGESISGSDITARGWTDEDNAKIVAVIVGNGRTNTVDGLVERGGVFWVKNLPISPGANELVLTATDPAGNVSHTNLTVYQSEVVLDIDPVPEQDLTNFSVRVTGKVSPPGYDVWVNGLPATVDANGRWVVARVPLSGMGGAAVFDATAVPKATSVVVRPKPAAPTQLVSIQAAIGTKELTLNASQQACGTFVLHLSGTEGKNFVLLDSTNLLDWRPVLTNLNSATSFDFKDTNMNNYGCRFFRVVPLP